MKRFLISIILLSQVATAQYGARSVSGYYGTKAVKGDTVVVPSLYIPEYDAVLDYAATQGWALPSDSDKYYQNIMLDSLVSQGIWDTLDVFYVMAHDAGEDFARINWINPGTYTLTKVGTPQWLANMGWNTLSGTSGLETGYQPSTHGGQFALNDATWGLWIKAKAAPGQTIFSDGNASGGITFRNGFGTGGGNTCNSSSNRFSAGTPPNDGYIDVGRISSSTVWRNYNGTRTSFSSTQTGAIDNSSFILLNNKDVASGFGTTTTISIFFAGAYIGDNRMYDILNDYMTYINAK